MWSLLFLVFLLPDTEARICPVDTGSVFLVAEQHSDIHNHCFDYCGRTNCTAVLINPSGCVALSRDDIPPPDSRTIAVHKHCVQNIDSTQIVLRETNQVLLDHTEKIEKTMDAFHCLSLCAQQTKFTCRSLMFYEESGDCLLNSANSDTAETSKDTDGFKVTYMERRLPGDAPCVTSFAALPPLGARLRGEFRKGNATSWEKCLLSCDGCDKVIFGRECLYLDESNDGKIVDISTQIVFKNICKETISFSCSLEESLFVSRIGSSDSEGRDCLNSCINTKDCQYAYKENEMCKISPIRLTDKMPVIERVCPGLGALESGVLFEEQQKCPSGNGQRFTGLNLYQCMALCLSHPSGSCDSISFHVKDEICELLDSSSISDGTSTSNCQHFSLGIIEEKQTKEKKKFSGKTGNSKSSSMSVDETMIDLPTEMFKFTHTEFEEKSNLTKRNGDELSVETTCTYSSLQVKVVSHSTNFEAHLFVRNGFEKCATEFKGGKAILALPLNSSEACAAEKNGDIYKAVIIIKKKTNDDIPIITAKDQMYTVSCDYSNQHAKLNISRQLQIRDLPYNSMDIGGYPKKPKLVEMELRSKRDEVEKRQLEEIEDDDDIPLNHPIILGHPLELAIKQSSKQFRISSCVAESHNGQENVTLVEDGCPTLTAKDYIIRGNIKIGKKGFILPLRAFKFRQGNIVRISCTLERCENCEKPICGQRSRRNLPSTEGLKEEVFAQLLVREQENIKHNSLEGKICLKRKQFLLGGIVLAVLITVELTVAACLAWKTNKISHDNLSN